jgi:hypothetical protein
MPHAPAFAWNGAWAVSFVVPATIGSRLGRLSAAEFAGQRTDREATISRTACDFRPTDPSGVNGPIARAFGSSTTNFFTADPSRIADPYLGRYVVWESSGSSGEPGIFVQDAAAMAAFCPPGTMTVTCQSYRPGGRPASGIVMRTGIAFDVR